MSAREYLLGYDCVKIIYSSIWNASEDYVTMPVVKGVYE